MDVHAAWPSRSPYLDVAALSIHQHDVLGLDVAVHDAGPHQGLQRRQHLDSHPAHQQRPAALRTMEFERTRVGRDASAEPCVCMDVGRIERWTRHTDDMRHTQPSSHHHQAAPVPPTSIRRSCSSSYRLMDSSSKAMHRCPLKEKQPSAATIPGQPPCEDRCDAWGVRGGDWPGLEKEPCFDVSPFREQPPRSLCATSHDATQVPLSGTPPVLLSPTPSHFTDRRRLPPNTPTPTPAAPGAGSGCASPPAPASGTACVRA